MSLARKADHLATLILEQNQACTTHFPPAIHLPKKRRVQFKTNEKLNPSSNLRPHQLKNHK